MFRGQFWPFHLFIALSLSSCENNPNAGIQKRSVTWSSEIAPIIYKNCTPCHRPEQSGSFNLLSYEDAKKPGRRIRFAVSTRYMPPWPADPSYSHFVGERVLTQEEIKLIDEWVT